MGRFVRTYGQWAWEGTLGGRASPGYGGVGAVTESVRGLLAEYWPADGQNRAFPEQMSKTDHIRAGHGSRKRTSFLSNSDAQPHARVGRRLPLTAVVSLAWVVPFVPWGGMALGAPRALRARHAKHGKPLDKSVFTL